MSAPNKQLKTLTPAQFAFVKWLYEKHPNVAKAAEEHHESLAGFLDTAGTVFNNIMTKAPDLLKQYVTGQQQIQELKLNLARAKAGQYPVDSDGNVYTGGAMRAQPQGVPTWVWIGGGALIAYLLLTLSRR